MAATGAEKWHLFIFIDARDKKVHLRVKEYVVNWNRLFRSCLDGYPESWAKLLSNFPFASMADGRVGLPLYRGYKEIRGTGEIGEKGLPRAAHAEGNQQMETSADALAFGALDIDSGLLTKEFKRYVAFNDFEMRVASPNCHASIDKWYRGEEIGEDENMRARFDVDEFFVRPWDIRRSAMGDASSADWVRWDRYKNSMLIPSNERNEGKPGREKMFWREVLCICFPAFAWLMGKNYTGEEILQAWELLPIVRRRRPNTSIRTSAGLVR